MNRKITITYLLILLSSNLIFSQYNIYIKADYNYGYITPGDLNDYFNILNYRNNIFFDWYERTYESRKGEIENTRLPNYKNLKGYGIELLYCINNNLDVSIGFNEYKTKTAEPKFFKIPESWIDFPNRTSFRSNYNFYSIPLKFYLRYNIFNNLRFYTTLSFTLNIGEFSEEYLEYYDIRTASTRVSEKMYRISDKSTTPGYSFTIGTEVNIYSRLFLEIDGAYKYVVHEFNPDREDVIIRDGSIFKYNSDGFEFELSGLYFSAGLKIGIY